MKNKFTWQIQIETWLLSWWGNNFASLLRCRHPWLVMQPNIVTWQETKQHRCNIVALVPVKGRVPLVNLEGIPYLFCNKILSPCQDPCTIQWELVTCGLGVFLDGWAGGVCALGTGSGHQKSWLSLPHILPTRGIASFSTGSRPGWLSFPHILKIACMTKYMHWPHQLFKLLIFLAQPDST